ncbi:MAG: protein kinase [Nocardioidaceae bacterium]
MPPLPAAVEVAAYRIVTEALTNVARHADSPTASVRLRVTATDLVIDVRDSGRGGGPWTAGVGLSSMRERVEQMGGRFEASADRGGHVLASSPWLRAPGGAHAVSGCSPAVCHATRPGVLWCSQPAVTGRPISGEARHRAGRESAMESDIVAGRYRVVRAVGKGGMGTVWLGTDETLHRDVALKQVGSLPGESPDDTARAMREARLAAALNHQNAVSIFDVVEHEGSTWLVMEYVPSQTLSQLLAAEGRLSPKRVAHIGAQVAAALSSAHSTKIVHRDIKPGNILVGDNDMAKISDFGIARGDQDSKLTQTGMVSGTAAFFSPSSRSARTRPTPRTCGRSASPSTPRSRGRRRTSHGRTRSPC